MPQGKDLKITWKIKTVIFSLHILVITAKFRLYYSFSRFIGHLVHFARSLAHSYKASCYIKMDKSAKKFRRNKIHIWHKCVKSVHVVFFG